MEETARGGVGHNRMRTQVLPLYCQRGAHHSDHMPQTDSDRMPQRDDSATRTSAYHGGMRNEEEPCCSRELLCRRMFRKWDREVDTAHASPQSSARGGVFCGGRREGSSRLIDSRISGTLFHVRWQKPISPVLHGKVCISGGPWRRQVWSGLGLPAVVGAARRVDGRLSPFFTAL